MPKFLHRLEIKHRKPSLVFFASAFFLLNLTAILKPWLLGLSYGNFQISDAGGWFGCIHSLERFGFWPDNYELWCYRRPYYPLIASYFLFILKSPISYFIFVNFLFSLISYFFMASLKKIGLGNYNIYLLASTVEFFWLQKAATQFMTEQFGLLLSVLAVSLLISGLHFKNNILLIYSLIASQFSQLVRPGNLLIPIFLLIYIIYRTRSKLTSILSLFTLILTNIIFMLPKYAFGIRDYGNSGNAWSVIYGLTSGNRSYNSVFEDFAGKYSNESQLWDLAKSEAISNIFKDPISLIQTIFYNDWLLIQKLPSVIISNNLGYLSRFETNSIIAIMIVLFIIVVARYSIPIGAFIGFTIFILVEMVFWGAVEKSDPVRTMSGSIPYLLIFIPLIFQLSR